SRVEEDLPGDDRSDEEIAERGEDAVEGEPAEPGEMNVDEEIVEDAKEQSSSSPRSQAREDVTEDEAAADEDDADAALAEDVAGDETGTDDEPSSNGGELAGTDLQVLDGVGPTYADEISEAGIDTVEQLADADVVAVAEETDVPVGRLEDWVDQAQAYRDEN
ncbi:MAG TPA: helix-hairpin-helix domain-containing protein, partial [Natronoarchaeum rubrum]|nr:helix-hairpin-helix domain-containing protein [Natronoarchaeum rubrum]